jgi:lipopolysaccharide heptosyltransferase II
VTWAEARRVLCVRLDALGDLLMTTPAIRALASARDDRRISVLASPAGVAAAALVPEIDEAIVYDAPWMKATAPRASSAPDLAMVDRLRAGRFDAAVIFTVYSQNPLPSAMLCYLAGIPLRLAHCHENPYQLLTDWLPDPEPGRSVRHEVRRQLELVAAVGAAASDERLSVRVPPAARERARARLHALGIGDPSEWLLVHVGASAASRRYDPERFAIAARRLVETTGRTIVLSGTHEERPLVDAVRDQIGPRAHSIAGMVDLAEMAALVADAPLLISNNSAPVHLAAAAGTPVVVLYALTNPQHTPWRVASRVLYRDVPCKYCYKSICPEGHGACLNSIEPDDIVHAALALLSGRPDTTTAGDPPLAGIAAS